MIVSSGSSEEMHYKKFLKIFIVIIAVLLVAFLTVFILAKTKVIFIN